MVKDGALVDVPGADRSVLIAAPGAEAEVPPPPTPTPTLTPSCLQEIMVKSRLKNKGTKFDEILFF